jgi:glycerol-3-phosphate dehydrogenase
MTRVDVLIFGGGAAGLWCLDRFRRSGYRAILLESSALGAGQTIQAQGIIHGGGKYALRGVRDFAAVRATSAMPERWRKSLSGDHLPRLTGTRVLAEQCHLWMPRGSFLATAQAWGFGAVVRRARLLATEPRKLDESCWPDVLYRDAAAVFSLSEPVISTGSFLMELAAQHNDEIYLTPHDIAFRGGAWHINQIAIAARATVLTAGAGNAALLREAGIEAELMQRRPLTMILLRGALPPFFGHCVIGGKAQLTITTPAPGIWQIGGEIAERLAREENSSAARRQALDEIARRMPSLNLSATEIALYRAERAEAKTADLRRPSGVHACYVAPGLVAAWPTKLCLTPVLADEVFDLVSRELKSPTGDHEEPLPWPKPKVATYPWEEAQWFSAV